jgi:hypothetical protein
MLLQFSPEPYSEHGFTWHISCRLVWKQFISSETSTFLPDTCETWAEWGDCVSTKQLEHIFFSFTYILGLLAVMVIRFLTHVDVVVVYVSGVKLSLWAAVTSGPIFHPPGDRYMGMDSHGRMTLRGKPKTTLSTTNPTLTDFGEDLVLCSERPESNHLSHGTAFDATRYSLL